MVKIGDILNRKEKARLYESVRKHVLDLPNVKSNSWDAFFIIIFLILVSDKKIRPAEQDFFVMLTNSIFDKSWESAKLIRGKIPQKGRQVNLASKVLSIYEEIRSLEEDSITEVVDALAANITDKELQSICLLCIVRLAISDLELARYERKLILIFADSWNITDLLVEIKFTELREQPEENFVRDLLGKNYKLLDRRGLLHEQYEETVHLIHERGLNIPGDELVSEKFKIYRYETDEKHEQEIKDIRKEHAIRDKERKTKHLEEYRRLNKKFRYKRSRFGPSFICNNFLTELNFHKDSFDNLDEKFESSDIWKHLKKLNEAEHIKDPTIVNKRIKARKDWLEITDITTGRNSLGRIYYHESNDERWLYHVFVHAKVDEKSQKKIFKQLDNWRKNGFS